MAINIRIGQVTTSTVQMYISGLDSEYLQKQIQIYLDGSLVDTDVFTIYSGGTAYLYTSNDILSPSTTYDIYIRISEWDGYGYIYEGQSNTEQITTPSSGGGLPTYIVYESSGRIVVQIQNFAEYFDSYFYLYDSSSSSVPIDESGRLEDQDIYYFSGVSSGETYYVECEYADADSSWNRYSLQNRDTGQIRTSITIGGGSDWRLQEERAGTVSSSFTYSYPNGFSAYTLYRMSITFTQNVNVTFSTSGNADTRCWLSDYTQTAWTDGVPDNYLAENDDGGSGNNFSLTYSCVANQVYYLWYRTWSVDGDSSYITLSVDISSTPAVYPTYTAQVINDNQISFTVSNRGSYYLRYFVRLTDSPQTTIYDTWDTYGYLVTDTTLTVSNLSYNTSYTVNVGYSSSSNSGTVTWIGSNVLQTGGSQGFVYTQISGITLSTSQVTKNISFGVDQGVIVPITISQSGTLLLYTQTNASSTMDDFGYLTDTINISPNPTTGALPAGSFLTSDDDSHGNREFQITWPSIAGTYLAAGTYYLWIKGYYQNGASLAITTVLYASFTAAPAPSTDGYMYIYTGSGGWKKAIPYIYTGSGGWKKAIPYLYDGSNWRKGGG